MEKKNTHLKELVTYLKDRGHGHKQKDIAEVLGYTTSAFSQILNGHVDISGKFVQKVLFLEKNINADWLYTGEGEMLNPYKKVSSPDTGVQEEEILYDLKSSSDKSQSEVVELLLKALSAINTKNKQLKEENEILRRENEILKTKKK